MVGCSVFPIECCGEIPSICSATCLSGKDLLSSHALRCNSLEFAFTEWRKVYEPRVCRN